MTWSPGPVVTRRRLGGELKRLREGAGLKLEDVARKLECSQSKISRLENGKGVPRWRDVRDMLQVYGVPEGEERERLLEWARTGQAKMWWQSYADIIPSGTLTYVELEWDATRIDAFEAHIVHGLLAMVMIAAILGHIYIGSVGMEGAFEGMSTGRVDYNWAKEHHSVWLEEEAAKARQAVAPPAGARAVGAD